MNTKMEFHISRKSRDLYKFDELLFASNGNVIFANFHAARVFADKMNSKRDLINFPEQAVQAGQINAMGLIDEILHYVLQLYREQENPDAMAKALIWLTEQIGEDNLDKTLLQFADEFPALAVYKNKQKLEEYLKSETDGVPNRQIVLEEMLMLWLANENPAFSLFGELFDDESLEKQTSYRHVMTSLYEFFENQPRFGPDNENIMYMLQAPARAESHSLSAQLEFIRKRWGHLLGSYLYRLLSSLDFIKEEQKVAFLGPGPALVYEFAGLEREPERFSADRDWMPKVVLLAKNAHVWLDQLSRKYKKPIDRLDQVPDEELNTLARWGFSGLWLIGLWQRSAASKKIKQMTGNPEAEASAYSLHDYDIADDLGGWDAYQNLRDRAWQRGIRMSGDMVPNHVGIDARWVVEHPDWFVSLDYSPYPSYTFNGPNLSHDDRVGIYLEDHYYDRTDAAVVFKRVDHWSGAEKYIYHGNDGTSMPWSDTAQINYLNAEAREAVIQTILHVARNFPIIRFDAAMVLTKKHFKRLWFPDPGTGGAIPSRAEHAITREQFDSLMTEEFWREVVDRVAQEVPDTLLLAEAFWLLEGYFVRSLGMHRVYNSAFMNMLKTEENANYRSVIKNTIEFNPEILKRFVNFMSNPDEDTAIAQFGDDDKYFGVCVLMATMPGLPMFGHGQIEGFREKYGMEFRRAYWDEQPSEHLIQRHEREIFPLLQRRFLFSDVQNFLLYDVFSPEGFVNEDIFAYSNRAGDERALVVYHNKFADARGWIHTSVGYLGESANGEQRIMQKNLGEGLAILNDANYFCIFRDEISGLEYIRNNRELHEQGLFVDVGAFKYHVFLDFRQVQDNEWHQYAHLASYLDGRGVPSIEEALREIFLQPIHAPFKELVNRDMFTTLQKSRITNSKDKLDQKLLAEVEKKIMRLLQEIKSFQTLDGDEKTLAEKMTAQLASILRLPVFEHDVYGAKKQTKLVKHVKSAIEEHADMWGALYSWTLVHSLGQLAEESDSYSRAWIDEWLFGKIIAGALSDIGVAPERVWPLVLSIKIMTTHREWFDVLKSEEKPTFAVVNNLLKDSDVQKFLQVNRHQGILWFNQQAFGELLDWLLLVAVIDALSDKTSSQAIESVLIDRYKIIQNLQRAEELSGYQVESLVDACKKME